MQFYTDTRREENPHALPDAETFERFAYTAVVMVRERGAIGEFTPHTVEIWAHDDDDARDQAISDANCDNLEVLCVESVEQDSDAPTWWYRYCLPGCLPDSSPEGPFATEAAAIDAARESAGHE